MKLILPFLICLLTKGAIGQNDHFLVIGAGMGYTSVMDKGMSPLTYSGISLVPKLALERQHDRSFSYISISGAIGNVRPDIYGELTAASADYYRTDIDVGYLRSIKKFKEDQYQIYIGGSWNNYGNVRAHRAYSNNKFNYEYVSSLSLAGMATKEISVFKRQAQLRWQLMLPLFAFVQRPGFAFAVPHYYMISDPDYVDAFFKSGDLTTWNNYFRLNSNFSFHYYLKNTNSLRLSYLWDYYHYNKIQENRMQLGEHVLLFSLIFDL